MSRYRTATILMLGAALTASGCASGLKGQLADQQATMEAMRQQMAAIARESDQQGQELQALRRDVQQSGAKMTQVEEQVAVLTNRTENLSTRLSLLTDEMGRQREVAATPAPTQPLPLRFTEGPTPVPGNIQTVYDRARALYESRQPRPAIPEFTRVIEMNPQGDLADNAQYWIGECYYMMEDYPRALEAFRKVFEFRATGKYDDAQLKIGITYRHLNQREQAIAAFRELLQKYPDSPYAGIARRHLSELGG